MSMNVPLVIGAFVVTQPWAGDPRKNRLPSDTRSEAIVCSFAISACQSRYGFQVARKIQRPVRWMHNGHVYLLASIRSISRV
jgi:hypothetical protein